MHSIQTPWSIPNVVGHSIDPNTNKIDDTEGFGAFDSIFQAYSLGNRSIDVGGGEHDYNKAYCFQKYGIQLEVYDPYMRHKSHNEKILKWAKEKPFDSCTSISVLNVIDEADARVEHIKLCRSVIKQCGEIFFKIWPGDGTGIPRKTPGGFQNNKSLEAYLGEIAAILGHENVFLDKENKIIRYKRSE